MHSGKVAQFSFQLMQEDSIFAGENLLAANTLYLWCASFLKILNQQVKDRNVLLLNLLQKS
jgi:hypothetical protein